MAGKAKDEISYGTRVGESPPPGHWACEIPGFAGAGYLAAGFDALAGQAGFADGLALLLAALGLRVSEVLEAGAQQLRDWYYACYAEHGSGRQAPAWDVVSFSAGLFDFGSGGIAARPSSRLRARCRLDP
jgi:hypothetical protein